MNYPTVLATDLLRRDWRVRWDLEKSKILIWKRDGGICADCHMRVERYDVHHIMPIRDGGTLFALDNLQTRCRSCHKKKHRGKAW